MDFRWHFLVVTIGKPSARSKRICWPNTLQVPVPVRSLLKVPVSRTRRISSRYCFMPCILFAVGPPHQGSAGQNHGYTQQLTEGQPAEGQVADVAVRLTDEFDDETEHPVADAEQAADGHGRPRLAGVDPENGKQRHPLQGKL